MNPGTVVTTVRRGASALAVACVALSAFGGATAVASGGDCDNSSFRGRHHVSKCDPPDLKIIKTGPVSIRFGETATFTVAVKNVGKVAVQRSAIHVTDPTVTSAELAFARIAIGDADTSLEPGEVWEYVLPGPDRRPVTMTPATCDPLVNTARVAPLSLEKYRDNNQSTATTKVICVPDLGISKTSDKGSYAPGESITYTVTVTNVGPIAVPFSSIAVSDVTLPGLTLVGAPPTTLEPGKTLSYTAVRVATAADCGTISNTATVAVIADDARHGTPPTPPRPPGEENLANNTAEATVAVVCTSSIAISKSASAQTVEPGQAITYTVTVRNTGQAGIPSSQIKVTDPAVPNLSLVGTAPATLAPGATLTYTGSRSTSAADCGPLGNTATVTVSGPPPLTQSAAVTVVVAGSACVPPALDTTLQIKKTGPTSARARSRFTHTLRVTNTGFVTATNVVVTDPVPAGLSVVKQPAGATFTKGTLRWELGDLGPGESRVVSVLLTTTFRGTADRCNVAQASAANASPETSRLCTRFARVAGASFVPPRVTG